MLRKRICYFCYKISLSNFRQEFPVFINAGKDFHHEFESINQIYMFNFFKANNWYYDPGALPLWVIQGFLLHCGINKIHVWLFMCKGWGMHTVICLRNLISCSSLPAYIAARAEQLMLTHHSAMQQIHIIIILWN